jgi:hypothetical protein
MFLPDRQDGTSNRTFVAPALTRWVARQDYDNWNWSSSGPATSFYTYMNNDYDCEFCAHALTGNVAFNDANQNNWTPGSKAEIRYTKMSHAGEWNNTIGIDRGSSYNPFRVTALFIKNPTNSSISHTFRYAHSNHWSSGHDGVGLAVGTPNNTDKAQVTGLNWTRVEQRTGQTIYYDTHGTNVNLPANKTSIVLLAASNHYWSGTAQQSWFNDLATFFNMHTFAGAGLEFDLDMYQTVHQGRIQYQSQTNNFFQYWNRCAEHFPPEETP